MVHHCRYPHKQARQIRKVYPWYQLKNPFCFSLISFGPEVALSLSQLLSRLNIPVVLLLCIILLALARVSFTDLPCTSGLTVGLSDCGLRPEAGDEEASEYTDSNILEACRSSSAASDILLSIVKSVFIYTLNQFVQCFKHTRIHNKHGGCKSARNGKLHGARPSLPKLNEFRIY